MCRLHLCLCAHLVLLAPSLLVVFQDVISDVVLRVDEKLLGVPLLFSALHPHHEQKHQTWRTQPPCSASTRWSTLLLNMVTLGYHPLIALFVSFSLALTSTAALWLEGPPCDFGGLIPWLGHTKDCIKWDPMPACWHMASKGWNGGFDHY